MDGQQQQEGDDFTEIVEKYADFVYNIALRMTNDPHDAEDIAQDAFLSAYKAYSSFRGQSQVSTWLYRITVNACLMKIRKEKKAKLLTQTGIEDVNIPDWTGEPGKAAVNAELRRALEEAVARLPHDLRIAVVLRDAQGYSGQETADILEISVASLKSRLHRARVLLRKHLEDVAVRPA
ncbi:MAG: sigma-70 family RNA polymerase sigma factor [Chloroflexi bacterium]|nr:sigma-70 family RNA polymerase sigma factor [Chloroflexota bacterium]